MLFSSNKQQLTMKKSVQYESLPPFPHNFRNDLPKLPEMGFHNNNHHVQSPENCMNALEEKLVVFPKIANQNEPTDPSRQDNKVNQQTSKLFNEHNLKRNSSTNKKRNLSMRVEKKNRKDLHIPVVLDEQFWSNRNHLDPVTTKNKHPKIVQFDSDTSHKQRILTDVTTNDRNYLQNPQMHPPDLSFVKAIVRKKSSNFSPPNKYQITALEERRRKFPDRKIIRSNYSRPKRFITDASEIANYISPEHNHVSQKSILFQRSQTHPIVPPLSLFSDIQTTLTKRQHSNSKPPPRYKNNISFFKQVVNNPEQRIKQLETKLKKLEEHDPSPNKNVDIAQTTSGDQNSNREHQPISNGESWRHVSVTNSVRHLIIEESSFLDEVQRLKNYMSRNDQMIQKYISERKGLIETVLNSQVTNYLKKARP